MEYYAVILGDDLSSHKRQEGTSSAYCYVKEVNLYDFILYDSDRKTFWKRQTKETVKR